MHLRWVSGGISLIGTDGALLGNFASGWAEVGYLDHDGRRCAEPNVLMRRELHEWPNSDDAKDLAYRLGDQIENSWGETKWRRYIATEGANTGEFDTGKYGWP